MIYESGRFRGWERYTRSALNPHISKPMMLIGDKAILEVMLYQMHRAGINEFILTVGHLAGLMRAYFQDVTQFGMNISDRY